jgi:Integrase
MESLCSVRDLEVFGLEAERLIETGSVSVTRGTKGGRPRITQVIKSRAEETLMVIRDALLYSRDNGGYLIIGAKSDLRSAKSKYHRLVAEFGLKGRYTPHSLRYAYAIDKIIEMRDAGLNRKEAMSLVAQFLGHGDSRNRYISMVYGREVAHTLPPEKRKKRLDRAIDNLSNSIEQIKQSGSEKIPRINDKTDAGIS